MANTVYENFVLESKFTDLLNTKLNTRSLMAIDTSLAENAGMKKVINVYTYAGTVEELAMGEANTVRGAISFEPVEYEVNVSQQVFDYFDEQFMQDPNVVEAGMTGASQTMVNDMNNKFFGELAKATVEQEYALGAAISYDTVVDAIAKMNLEDETALMLIIGLDSKAALRKDPDFMASKMGEILYTGQIGTISGIPVVVSKKVAEGEAYVMERGAIKLFVKKESEIEQERDAERRENTVIMRKVALVALVDATKVVKIVEAIA